MSSNRASNTLPKLVSELNEIERLRDQKLQEINSQIKSLPNDENLLYFYGESCPFTKRVAPEIQCLESTIGRQITKKEVWDSQDNQLLYQTVGGQNNCGGVPYFYNKLNGKSICGASTCEKLLLWANSTSPTATEK